jgi:hypothetical protein
MGLFDNRDKVEAAADAYEQRNKALERGDKNAAKTAGSKLTKAVGSLSNDELKATWQELDQRRFQRGWLK